MMMHLFSCRFWPLVSVVLVLWSSVTGHAQNCIPNGDVDDRNGVTPIDAMQALQAFLDIRELDMCARTRANVINPDSSDITPEDVLCILQDYLQPTSCLATLFPYGSNPNPQLQLASNEAGESPAHRLTFDVASGELETYQAIVTYPEDFRFNGFDVLGPLNTPVGDYTLDVGADGVVERVVQLRSLSRNMAYVDVLADERFSPALEPVLELGNRTELFLRLPFGGDLNTATVIVPFAVRMNLTLFQGLLTNPLVGGDYTLHGTFTSVDPDTDGASDGMGTAPLVLSLEVTVTIAAEGQ